MLEKFLIAILLLAIAVAVLRLKIVLGLLEVFRHKFIYVLVVPIFLLSLWVVLSAKEVYKLDHVLLQLTTEFSRNNLQQPKYGELLKGQKITGEFKANENYLGIVSVRFWNFYRLSDDYVVFRLKEKGANQWYYQNSHKVDQFQANGYFTFGFPVIENSENKTYQFEIESTNGIPGNAIGLSEIEPAFAVVYKYPRNVVTSSYKSVAYFATRKVRELLHTPKFVGSSFIYALPFIVYVVGKSFFATYRRRKSQESLNSGNKLFDRFHSFLVNDKRASYYCSVAMMYVALFADIFWIRKSDTTVIILLMLWIAVVKLYKIPMERSYQLAGILLVLAFATWYTGEVNIQITAERALAWAFLFVLFATVQMALDLKK